MELSLPQGYSEARKQTLWTLSRGLAEVEDRLSSLVVYGSVARGEARADSDLNLAVVLNPSAAVAALEAMREPFRIAFRHGRVDPFIVRIDEIPRLCDVFPAKLLDIQAHHDCIWGDDPFVALEIAPADLRFRLEQELRNQLLRMRRFYLFRGDDAQQIGQQLDQAIASFAVEMEALVRLTAGAVALPKASDALAQARELLDADPALIERLLAHRSGQLERSTEAERQLYRDLMALLTRAVEHVDRLEVPR